LFELNFGQPLFNQFLPKFETLNRFGYRSGLYHHHNQHRHHNNHHHFSMSANDYGMIVLFFLLLHDLHVIISLFF